MPLDNFSNLKASIKSRSHRNDVNDNDLTDYVTQCESEFYNNTDAALRIRAMEVRATNTVDTSSRFLSLPDRFLKMRRLKLNDPFNGGCDTDIDYLTPEQMPLCNLVQRPRFFSVTTQLEFDSVPDKEYTIEMQYVQRLTALSDSNPTNVILDEHPNIYLFGSLWALFDDKQEIDVAADYYAKFLRAIAGANATDQAGRYGPAPFIRQEGYLP